MRVLTSAGTRVDVGRARAARQFRNCRTLHVAKSTKKRETFHGRGVADVPAAPGDVDRGKSHLSLITQLDAFRKRVFLVVCLDKQHILGTQVRARALLIRSCHGRISPQCGFLFATVQDSLTSTLSFHPSLPSTLVYYL